MMIFSEDTTRLIRHREYLRRRMIPKELLRHMPRKIKVVDHEPQDRFFYRGKGSFKATVTVKTHELRPETIISAYEGLLKLAQAEVDKAMRERTYTKVRNQPFFDGEKT